MTEPRGNLKSVFISCLCGGPALAAHQESAEQAFKVQISEPCPGPRERKTQEDAGRLVEGSPQEVSALT